MTEQMKTQFYTKTSKTHDVLILPVSTKRTLFANAKPLNQGASGLYAKIVAAQDDIGDKDHGKIVTVPVQHEDLPYKYLVLVAMNSDMLNSFRDFEELGANAFTKLDKSMLTAVCVFGTPEGCAIDEASAAAAFANGFVLKSYNFVKYKTKDADKKVFKELSMSCGDSATQAAKIYKDLEAVTYASFAARDLVTEPANKINPVTYAAQVKDMFKGSAVKVTVLDDKKMAKMGMEAIVGVGKGSSDTPSRMVIMEYNGLGKGSSRPEAAFVGKGVTFDTGGISIKPGAGMEDMKFDMAGSAAVVGLMKALADRGAKVHVVGAIGLAENMLSEKAYRPSDVLTSYSGQTIEVINTDAEGRLVLADTLTYVQRQYKPKTVIDLATLTGAMLVALGHEFAGTFSTSDALYADLEAAGEAVEEFVWRMPLSKEYDKQLDSPIADMKNLGGGRWAGSCTAAAFLQRFVEGDTEWAHIDIAGTAWRTSPRSFAPKGATGYGVRLLNEFVKNRYEK